MLAMTDLLPWIVSAEMIGKFARVTLGADFHWDTVYLHDEQTQLLSPLGYYKRNLIDRSSPLVSICFYSRDRDQVVETFIPKDDLSRETVLKALKTRMKYVVAGGHKSATITRSCL